MTANTRVKSSHLRSEIKSFLFVKFLIFLLLNRKGVQKVSENCLLFVEKTLYFKLFNVREDFLIYVTVSNNILIFMYRIFASEFKILDQ